MRRPKLPQIVQHLEAYYGPQKPPRLKGPWEWILWVNVAYLADDARRRKAFQALKKSTGMKPERIFSAPDDILLEATGHGILANRFAEKLRDCARIAGDEFQGDLGPVLKLPLTKALRALQRFPGIGKPGAEKILLFARSQPVFAIDSNGLRALLRLGFGAEKKSYSTTYRLVQQAAQAELGSDFSQLIRAHLLLRRHGQELCRQEKPKCGSCPLEKGCEFAQLG